MHLIADVAVVGGGIAGLWLLARLRSRGYHTVLVECRALGAGQTRYSQGIIHGGVKYALGGTLSGASEAIAGMPARWRRCLAGDGELDLRRAELLSGHQYLITTAGLASRLGGLFAARALRSRLQKLARQDYPPAFGHTAFRGTVYRLDEPVLDVATVLQALAAPLRSALASSTTPATVEADGTVRLTGPDGGCLDLRARRVVLTAGAGNATLSRAAMQRRPLQMVLMRADELPALYGHFLGLGDKPRLTVTTHRDRAGRPVWYLGGALAETGVERSAAAQIDVARRELTELLPWVNLDTAGFATLPVDRAEGRQPDGRRPDTPVLVGEGAVIAAWPTKLALAPLLADAVLEQLRTDGIEPRGGDALPADWPRPVVADYPWDDETLQWC